MSDSLTAELARNLDRAFEPMVRAHQDRLYSLALRYLGSAADAEELTQDSFVRAYRAMQRYDGDRILALDLRAWLTTILLNLCRNHAASAKRRPGAAKPDLELPADPSASPEASVLRRDAAERWAGLVRQLPPVYRAAVLLRHLDGMSYPEIAGVLGRPEGTVKAQVHRGVALLRAAFEAEERARAAIVPQAASPRVRVRALEAVS